MDKGLISDWWCLLRDESLDPRALPWVVLLGPSMGVFFGLVRG